MLPKIEPPAGVEEELPRRKFVVICSADGNSTPPQQALNWNIDLYDDVEEIRAAAQTIVDKIHETIGRLERVLAEAETSLYGRNVTVAGTGTDDHAA